MPICASVPSISFFLRFAAKKSEGNKKFIAAENWVFPDLMEEGFQKT